VSARLQSQDAAKPAVPLAPKSPAKPATLEGRWAGTLQAGDAVLHLVLHLSKASDGSWKATIDSLDQGVFAIEASATTLDNATLTLTVSSVGASYVGKISAAHQTIDGLWSQGGAGLPLVFRHETNDSSAKKPSDAVSSAEGIWQGALEAKGMRVRLQLHISHDDKKQLVAALDNIDQGVAGLPAAKVSQKEDAIHIEIPAIEGSYDGTISATKNSITGTWSQPGESHKLDFKRSDQVLELLRPQTPVKPYPYREEEVSFINAKGNLTLAGTLTIPPGAGPFPAAILLAGSGPHDRDETIAGHRPFLVLADALSRKGIAVLRYDKRGNGKSTGDYATATTEDFAADASAAIDFLKSRKNIDAAKIGLIGHSEGGLIAPMIVASNEPEHKDISWIVLLAGPALNGEDTLLLQSELIARNAGLGEAQISDSLQFDREAYTIVREEKDSSAIESKVEDLVSSSGMTDAMPPAALKTQIRLLSSPWFRFFLDYDPVPALQRTTCPVLALNGEKDLQVPAAQNLTAMKKALEAAGNKDFQTVELPGLNHLFQHCDSGSPSDYGAIEETFSPEALTQITDWIQKHTSR
jgi:pimeloyl-ACP methyl ester carboxylesterase